MQLTEIDKKIIRVIQRHPPLAQAEQAELVGMSRSSFCRHVKDMEDAGVIGAQIPEVSAKNWFKIAR